MRVRLRRAKATPFGFCLKHCLRQLRNSSPKIYSCYDRQLYSGLQISHKIVAGWRGRAITRIYKFGKISRIFIGLLLFHIGKAGNFLWSPNTNTNTFLWSPNTLDQQTNIRTSRQGPITERGWVENWKDRNRLVGKMTLCLCKRLNETPMQHCCQFFSSTCMRMFLHLWSDKQ